MMSDDRTRAIFAQQFAENMPEAAFVCRADDSLEILYANQRLIRLFECETFDEYKEFVGNSFAGMVSDNQLRSIKKEVNLQVQEKKQASGRLFYHILSKKGSLSLAEEHWAIMEDPKEGSLFFCILIPREYENVGSDYDGITGLYGKNRFQAYANEMNKELCGKTKEKYAVAYLNLVNFKLLNVNKGIDEGDACLRAIADCLGYAFEDAFLARLSDDHFAVLDKLEDLERRMNESKVRFREKYGDRFGIVGKWGYFSFEPNETFDAEKALSFAKLACDRIKYVSETYIIEYSEQLAKMQNLSEHLVRSFDEALEKGWIKIYFQPVVRSITGQLCGMESLVRWIDPKYGFIMPGDFISVLESSRQIHKLDSYVVEQVCKTMRERLENGQPIVPVSVNFSRLDFILCDMLKVVEDAVEKYDIPRDYLHVEITESMIASDEDLMRRVINGFRTAGYEIWMDDFGSGYSSLTVLKDYQFDMLKLDMNFLSNFTDKSRDIMRSAIIMAKDLGIKTLAEGVETLEQLEYLKSIGCEQIQGYYYGKPEPIEDVFTHLREKGISIELRKWRHFYELASFHVKATDVPLEVIEDDGQNFRTLFMNEPYKEQIGVKGMELDEIDKRIYHTASPLLSKYREFSDQMLSTGKPETFYYTKDQTYLCLRGNVVSVQDGHRIIKASVYNITVNSNESQTELIDSKLRVLNLLFKVILLADLKNQTLTPLLGTSPTMRTQMMSKGNVKDNNALFADVNIFPTERIRYREFMDFSTAAERIGKSRFGYVSDVFRIKQPDGNYRAAEVSLMIIPGTDSQEFLYCVKPYLVKDFSPSEGVGGMLSPDRPAEAPQKDEQDFKYLWDNVLWNSSVKFFWKDRERRFLGASQAFLDFFNIKSLDEIIGKTDEDMHWRVDEGPCRALEMEVLQRGIRVMDDLGQCISKGVIHNILTNKMPIYRDGLIVGLAGYFLDIDKEMADAQEVIQKAKTDKVTGLMDARACVDATIEYAAQYREKKRNFGMILIRNARHDRILSTYGEETGMEALRVMSKVLVEVVGQSSVVARVRESIFAVLLYVEDEAKLAEKAEEIRKRLDGINVVQGNAVTMRIRIAYRLRSQEGVTDDNMYDETLREIMWETAE